MFITFEVIDGSGKTIQYELLANYFKQIHDENNMVLTREPSGTDFAQKVRGQHRSRLRTLATHFNEI
ncbi:unnamed protein product [Brugia pahangi]|uniref:Thymidylate_kin domain-containing protein n=1 Tax=Brugia pahangi TaxID=6280 RepID=A0A0N4T678_BRUPA|nr:unnamed protein product [Brugia pahangi]